MLKFMFKGKIIGAVLGGLAGGPLGAAFGIASGHAYDKHSGTQEDFISLICLGIIKAARLDGPISDVKIAEVERIFGEMRLGSEMRKRASVHFKRARQNTETLDYVAERFAQKFSYEQQRKLFFAIIIRMAAAGSAIDAAKRAVLQKAARALDVDAEEFAAFMGSSAGRAAAAPGVSVLEAAYETLGVSKNATNDEIRRVFRAKCKDLHPDVLRSKGIGNFAMKALEEELCRVKDAYETIRKHRG